MEMIKDGILSKISLIMFNTKTHAHSIDDIVVLRGLKIFLVPLPAPRIEEVI